MQQAGVNCLVDVRSIAASAYNPQYNKVALRNFLITNGIHYLHFGAEFGARRTEPHLLDERGKLCMEKVTTGELFLAGVARLQKGMALGYIIALMCAEADPSHCHRFHMISVYLAGQGIDVRHIFKEGAIVPHSALVCSMAHKSDKGKQAHIF
ncbi:hypothetical protein GCM10023093_12940 [Nemorincola caseinilytica]|uniref:DUF488 domain-containing protein n=1 Tax=Nemorincola caseinilytica TaxID=2054315 RepID=A0ABP8N9V0_9BACT